MAWRSQSTSLETMIVQYLSELMGEKWGGGFMKPIQVILAGDTDSGQG